MLSSKRGCITTLKLFALTGYPWRGLWYLDMQLKRKRHCDPALSWTDRCEAPSMVRSAC